MSGARYEFEGGQTSPHDDLERVVRRHLGHTYRRPVAPHNERAFARLHRWAAGRRLILDAGCGTGESTLILAERNPHALVVGVDRSLSRLARCALWKKSAVDAEHAKQDHCALLRADLEDLLRLMCEGGVRAESLFLLYPNPYPKASQLKRRLHAHPVFPALLASCQRLELRSNWRVYVDEFARACEIAVGATPAVERYRDETPMTAFERKYWASETPTYRLPLTLPRT